MNRKIRKYRAIEYIILCYAAVLMLLIGPLGIFDGSREVSGNENVQGKTAAVTQDASRFLSATEDIWKKSVFMRYKTCPAGWFP